MRRSGRGKEKERERKKNDALKKNPIDIVVFNFFFVFVDFILFYLFYKKTIAKLKPPS